jgi:hypothetical protein
LGEEVAKIGVFVAEARQFDGGGRGGRARRVGREAERMRRGCRNKG